VNGRLDLFAKFGPVLNHHNINSLGKHGRKLAIDWINKHKASIIEKEKDRLGLNTEKQKKIQEREQKKFGKAVERINLSPMILIPEQAVVDLWPELDDETRELLENSSFLVGGREQQHILTDFEINTMIAEVNRIDLLNILLVNLSDFRLDSYLYFRARKETAQES
jgi:hypothetical protein